MDRKLLWGITGSVLMLALVLSEWSSAQTTFFHRYVIEFTDKDDNPFSLDNPEEYLSQKALDRRNRYDIPIVENDLPVNPHYIQQVATTGVKILNRSKWLNSITIETSDSLALITIREFSFVKKAEEIAVRQAANFTIPTKKWNDASLKTSSFHAEDYHTAFHQLNLMHGEGLHDEGFRGEGMEIAVLDGGWYNTEFLDVFDSLYDEGRVLGVWNFVSGNDSVYQFSTHGTSVLSAIAANQPGTMIGTAPHVSVYLFLTEDVFSEYPIEEHNWATAAERADSLGADMISSSLGYSDFDSTGFDYTYDDMDGNTALSSRAASLAAAKGMIVCSSAGNSGQQPWFYISAPGDADSILTVGAVDSTATFTLFSSHGPSSDGRVKPNVVAQGIGAWVVNPALLDPAIYGSNNITFPGNGTSFSNPILAGMTACLWQKHRNKTNLQIIDAIERSASLYFNPNDSFGYGIPNFQLADLILSGKAPDDLTLQHPVAYPNPFSDGFGILYYESEPQEISVEVYDIIGRKVQSFSSSFQSGYNYLPITLLNEAANGGYFVKVYLKNRTDLFRMVKTD